MFSTTSLDRSEGFGPPPFPPPNRPLPPLPTEQPHINSRSFQTASTTNPSDSAGTNSPHQQAKLIEVPLHRRLLRASIETLRSFAADVQKAILASREHSSSRKGQARFIPGSWPEDFPEPENMGGVLGTIKAVCSEIVDDCSPSRTGSPAGPGQGRPEMSERAEAGPAERAGAAGGQGEGLPQAQAPAAPAARDAAEERDPARLATPPAAGLSRPAMPPHAGSPQQLASVPLKRIPRASGQTLWQAQRPDRPSPTPQVTAQDTFLTLPPQIPTENPSTAISIEQLPSSLSETSVSAVSSEASASAHVHAAPQQSGTIPISEGKAQLGAGGISSVQGRRIAIPRLPRVPPRTPSALQTNATKFSFRNTATIVQAQKFDAENVALNELAVEVGEDFQNNISLDQSNNAPPKLHFSATGVIEAQVRPVINESDSGTALLWGAATASNEVKSGSTIEDSSRQQQYSHFRSAAAGAVHTQRNAEKHNDPLSSPQTTTLQGPNTQYGNLEGLGQIDITPRNKTAMNSLRLQTTDKQLSTGSEVLANGNDRATDVTRSPPFTSLASVNTSALPLRTISRKRRSTQSTQTSFTFECSSTLPPNSQRNIKTVGGQQNENSATVIQQGHVRPRLSTSTTENTVGEELSNLPKSVLPGQLSSVDTRTKDAGPIGNVSRRKSEASDKTIEGSNSSVGNLTQIKKALASITFKEQQAYHSSSGPQFQPNSSMFSTPTVHSNASMLWQQKVSTSPTAFKQCLKDNINNPTNAGLDPLTLNLQAHIQDKTSSKLLLHVASETPGTRQALSIASPPGGYKFNPSNPGKLFVSKVDSEATLCPTTPPSSIASAQVRRGQNPITGLALSERLTREISAKEVEKVYMATMGQLVVDFQLNKGQRISSAKDYAAFKAYISKYVGLYVMGCFQRILVEFTGQSILTNAVRDELKRIVKENVSQRQKEATQKVDVFLKSSLDPGSDVTEIQKLVLPQLTNHSSDTTDRKALRGSAQAKHDSKAQLKKKLDGSNFQKSISSKATASETSGPSKSPKYQSEGKVPEPAANVQNLQKDVQCKAKGPPVTAALSHPLVACEQAEFQSRWSPSSSSGESEFESEDELENIKLDNKDKGKEVGTSGVDEAMERYRKSLVQKQIARDSLVEADWLHGFSAEDLCNMAEKVFAFSPRRSNIAIKMETVPTQAPRQMSNPRFSPPFFQEGDLNEWGYHRKYSDAYVLLYNKMIQEKNPYETNKLKVTLGKRGRETKDSGCGVESCTGCRSCPSTDGFTPGCRGQWLFMTISGRKVLIELIVTQPGRTSTKIRAVDEQTFRALYDLGVEEWQPAPVVLSHKCTQTNMDDVTMAFHLSKMARARGEVVTTDVKSLEKVDCA
ncbi:hypothetical protein BDZ91DRAFT_789998 [Kalaharituber pfeilii]|nr:hypothetical protein BDZ91DRAFT_789998 [Kalaharituber pfeilii]